MMNRKTKILLILRFVFTLAAIAYASYYIVTKAPTNTTFWLIFSFVLLLNVVFIAVTAREIPVNRALTKKQQVQVSIAALGLMLIVVWLFMPGWYSGKILGIVSAVLVIIAMTLSFIAEEKKKVK